MLIFGIGSMLRRVGGALSTFAIRFIGPDSFTLMVWIGFLAAIAGGLAMLFGKRRGRRQS